MSKNTKDRLAVVLEVAAAILSLGMTLLPFFKRRKK